MASSTTPSGHLNTRLVSNTHPILLRNVEVSDAPALAALLSDHRNMLYEGPDPPSPMSVETAEMVISRMRESAAAPSVVGNDGKVASGPGRVNLAVVYGSSEEEKLIGLGGFGSIKDLEDGSGSTRKKIRVGDVGVMLESDYRRKGFAVEAVRLSVEWGLRKADEGGLQLDKITAGTLVKNEGMVRLLEDKMGWKGVRRFNEEKGDEEMYYEILPTKGT